VLIPEHTISSHERLPKTQVEKKITRTDRLCSSANFFRITATDIIIDRPVSLSIQVQRKELKATLQELITPSFYSSIWQENCPYYIKK
jgi:hypothetical protein